MVKWRKVAMKKQSLGSRIKDLRESRNMTQAELAKLLFVSDKTVSKWEKGNSDPETEILIKMSQIFDVTLDYLLTGATKEKDTKVVSRIELACREDNIALLDGLDIEAFDEYGKNLEFYAKQYGSKNIQNYLLNYKIDKYVDKNRVSRKYHICALPKDSHSEEDLELIAWNGPYSKAAAVCAEYEREGYHGFKVFREIGVNEEIEQDYQYFFCHCLDLDGFNKIQFSIAILDDKQSGILNLTIYKDKTYKLNKKDDKGKLVPDYYPESSIESDYYAYVRPSVMTAFMKLLSDIDVSGWENRSWGHAVHDLFYVLKEQPKDDLGCHKYYVSPGKDLYKKLIKGIQQVCFESLKGHQNRRFVNVFNASTMPYYRAALPFRQSMQIFHDIDLEQKEMKEGHFDLAEDLRDD